SSRLGRRSRWSLDALGTSSITRPPRYAPARIACQRPPAPARTPGAYCLPKAARAGPQIMDRRCELRVEAARQRRLGHAVDRQHVRRQAQVGVVLDRRAVDIFEGAHHDPPQPGVDLVDAPEELFTIL